MTQYNLVRNTSFTAPTTSGTGNKTLEWNQLEKLMDGNTTSSGVSLLVTDVLYLDVDLSQRIKIDEIRLYASNLTSSGSISFYYKDLSTDSYTLLTTGVSTFYYTTITSGASAPQYVRTVISGVSIELYELEAINDSYTVEFGTDGSLYAEYLDNTPQGEEGTPTAIAIFNNGTSSTPANAYAVIDYTGEIADEYVKIAATENGTYYGIDDGVLLTDNLSTSEYRWGMAPTYISKGMIYLDDMVNMGKLCYLPTVTKAAFTYAGEHCWDYDEVNDKVYMCASDGIIKLYTLNLQDGTWTYIWEIDPGASDHQYNVAIAYLGGKIYSIIDDNNVPVFGCTDLAGAANNWTTLASPSPTVIADANKYYRYTICSDYSRYIYLIRNQRNAGADKYFARYDTTTDTWASLNTGFLLDWDYTNATWSSAYHMWYDTVRNVIYANAINLSSNENNINSSTRYLQRYHVASNTWNTSFIDIYSITTGSRGCWAFAYCNGVIYIILPYKTNKLYKYVVNTGSVTEHYLNYSLYNWWSLGGAYADTSLCYMMALKPSTITSGMGGELLVGQVTEDRTMVYHYQNTGIYYTPIFQLEDKFNSSYFLTEGTASTGSGVTGSISYNRSSYDGTIRVRGSNTAPLRLDEIYLAYRKDVGSSYNQVIHRFNVYTGVEDEIVTTRNDPQTNIDYGCAVDRKTGRISDCMDQWGTGSPTTGSRIYIFSRVASDSSLIYPLYVGKYNNSPSGSYYKLTRLGFDNASGIWGYDITYYRLFHYNADLTSILANVYDGTDFLSDMVPEWDGQGVWYTNKISNLLVHKNYTGTSLQSIALTQPRYVCATTDNGCWVADTTTEYAYRYSFAGALMSSVNLNRVVTRMTHDYADGFWYYGEQTLCHVTSAGEEDVTLIIANGYAICGLKNGCGILSSSPSTLRYVDYTSKSVARTWTLSYTVAPIYFGAFSTDLDDLSNFSGLDPYVLLPQTTDPVWGTGGSLGWAEVSKDGYFLPKYSYHQIEITMRGNVTLDKIVMPPAVKIDGIQSQSYKNFYVKTDIPTGASVEDYETRLKVWWEVE